MEYPRQFQHVLFRRQSLGKHESPLFRNLPNRDVHVHQEDIIHHFKQFIPFFKPENPVILHRLLVTHLLFPLLLVIPVPFLVIKQFFQLLVRLLHARVGSLRARLKEIRQRVQHLQTPHDPVMNPRVVRVGTHHVFHLASQCIILCHQLRTSIRIVQVKLHGIEYRPAKRKRHPAIQIISDRLTPTLDGIQIGKRILEHLFQ